MATARRFKCQLCEWEGTDEAAANAHEHHHHDGAQTCWFDDTTCPDGGRCHHACGPTACFRARSAAGLDALAALGPLDDTEEATP